MACCQLCSAPWPRSYIKRYVTGIHTNHHAITTFFSTIKEIAISSDAYMYMLIPNFLYFLSSVLQIWLFKQFAFDPALCWKETVTTRYTTGKRKSSPGHRKQKLTHYFLQETFIHHLLCTQRANADSRKQKGVKTI